MLRRLLPATNAFQLVNSKCGKVGCIRNKNCLPQLFAICLQFPVIIRIIHFLFNLFSPSFNFQFCFFISLLFILTLATCILFVKRYYCVLCIAIKENSHQSHYSPKPKHTQLSLPHFIATSLVTILHTYIEPALTHT